MLDNTKRGFIEEMLIVSTATAILGTIAVYYANIVHHYPGHSVIRDAVLTVFIFLVVFYFVRLVRMVLVYRNRRMIYAIGVFLMFLPFGFLIPAVPLNTLIFVSIIWSLLTLYIVNIAKRFKRFRVDIPPERYTVLRTILTKKQRLTLIFPDRYIRYLETGDKKYLGDEGNA